jgi:hypothetical protein
MEKNAIVAHRTFIISLLFAVYLDSIGIAIKVSGPGRRAAVPLTFKNIQPMY